jgi:adenine-specific DNA-methyltransferase
VGKNHGNILGAVMTFRYIGSKARIVEAIASYIGEPNGEGKFVDVFCGTGVVSEAASKMGWPVRLNDFLYSAVTMAGARLVGGSQARFGQVGGYEAAIDKLNRLRPKRGFCWKEYSPASSEHLGFERRYFTEHNAAKIDAIRLKIARWRAADEITQLEERLLIADLLSATNRVANIAGTYGCFLSQWQDQARNELKLVARELPSKSRRVESSVREAAKVKIDPHDVVYLDPPYTKRQYAAYYHILETVALGDNPAVEGVTGLRPWKHKASDFCYRTRALTALSTLISNVQAKRVLLSYSEEGHVPIGLLAESLSDMGDMSLIRLSDVGRYRPNKKSTDKSSVSEYLIVLDKREHAAA